MFEAENMRAQTMKAGSVARKKLLCSEDEATWQKLLWRYLNQQTPPISVIDSYTHTCVHLSPGLQQTGIHLPFFARAFNRTIY